MIRPRFGFRGSIALVTAALSLVTLGIAFTVVSVFVNRSQERQFDEALVAVADAEALELASKPGERIQISDRPGPSANDVGPLPLFGAVYAADGALIESTPTFRGAAPPISRLSGRQRRPFDFDWEHARLRGVMVEIPAGRASSGAKMLIAAERADLDNDAAFLRRAMMLVFGVAVAWTVLLAVGVATRLTRTHRTIVATTKRVVGGDLTARVGVSRPFDEMSALARNVDEMIDRLALLLGNQQLFIAHAAHELRSPLTTLYGELSNAVRRPRDAEEYKRAIEHALGSTRRLKDLAEDLLALARLAGEVPGAREQISLTRIIGDAIEQVRPEMAARRLTLEVEGDDVWTDGRGGDLTRMFRNLLENAVRHSPEGGSVTVVVAADDRFVTVRISDQGPGVGAQDAEAIFRPFIRGTGEPRRRGGGSGLGLTIARDIASLHGGEVSVVEPGQRGASFEVKLPRASPPSLRSSDRNQRERPA